MEGAKFGCFQRPNFTDTHSGMKTNSSTDKHRSVHLKYIAC